MRLGQARIHISSDMIRRSACCTKCGRKGRCNVQASEFVGRIFSPFPRTWSSPTDERETSARLLALCQDGVGYVFHLIKQIQQVSIFVGNGNNPISPETRDEVATCASYVIALKRHLLRLIGFRRRPKKSIEFADAVSERVGRIIRKDFECSLTGHRRTIGHCRRSERIIDINDMHARSRIKKNTGDQRVLEGTLKSAVA